MSTPEEDEDWEEETGDEEEQVVEVVEGDQVTQKVYETTEEGEEEEKPRVSFSMSTSELTKDEVADDDLFPFLTPPDGDKAGEWGGEGYPPKKESIFDFRLSGDSGGTFDSDGIFGSGWKVGDISDYEDEEDGMGKVLRELNDRRTGVGSFSDGWEYDDDGDDEEDAEEAAVPKVDKTLEKIMQIPEEPARVKLDQLAGDLTKRVDPVLKHFLPQQLDQFEFLPSDPNYQSPVEPRVDRCPSIESFFRMKKMIDVQFYLYPGGKMISRDCRMDATVIQLKHAVAQFVKVPAAHLDLRRKRNLVADQRTLLELGAGPRAKMKFTVEINKRIPGSFKLNLPKDKETIQPRSVTRTVRVKDEQGTETRLEVTIDFPTQPRPKLGGYIDSRSGQKFLHAAAGTDPMDAEAWERSELHKACQAFNDKTAQTQTKQDVGQQMEREDYYVSNTHDRFLRPKKYVSFSELQKKRAKAIITIQRYWRGWLGRHERKMRMEGLIKRIEWAEQIRKGRIEERYAIISDEVSRQECPKKMVDIELLYRAINLWRKEQEDYVMKNRWGAERKAALAILTEMEADLLLDLERTRKRIKDGGKERVIELKFNKMGKPKRWLGKTNTFITMDTKERLNVRQLHHTYRDLRAPVLPEGELPMEGSLTLEERLELLGRVNEMIKKVTNKLAIMLSDLITRELTYIRINCSNKLTSSLRKRIANCFFLLCQDPVFNPEAKRLQKVPFDYTKLRKDMVQCRSCRRMWYRDEFTIQRGTTVTTRCHMCMGLYRTAILRVDLNLYRHMLDELRRDELAAGVPHSVTFLIDAFDLQFLVEQIWHGQSALSGIDNRYLLRLCRWVKKEAWTPWNCVLLTEEEAVSHTQLNNMTDAYQQTFFHKVFVLQATAKTYFQGLGKLSISVDDKTAEGCERWNEREKKLKINKEKLRRKARLLKILSFK